MAHAASGVMSQSALRGAFANVKVRERANARTRRDGARRGWDDGATAIDAFASAIDAFCALAAHLLS